MTVELLKPCPFCDNSKPEVYHECNSNKELYRVKCRKCGIQTHLESKDRVIAIWNHRAEPDELPEWLKNELINGLILAKDDKTAGWNDAIEWVLSLRRDQ